MAANKNGHFVWHELLVPDAKAAITFYSETTGWQTQPFSDDYVMWVSGQGPFGGVTTLPEQAKKMGAPPYWYGYVQVADINEAASRVKESGGRVVHGPEKVPSVGTTAVIADPQGAVLSIFQPERPAEARDRMKEGEIGWNELMTSDTVAAAKFYSEVFAWKIVQEHDIGPMGVYRHFGTDGTKENVFGGMFTLPKGAPIPPCWIYYIETSDIAAAVGRAQQKGATIMNGPMEIPGGGGHIAQLADPQGAAFALHQFSKR